MKQLLFSAIFLVILMNVSCTSDTVDSSESEIEVLTHEEEVKSLGDKSIAIEVSESEVPIEIEVIEENEVPTSIIQFNGAGYGIEIEEEGVCNTIEREDFVKNLIPKEAAYACRCVWGLSGRTFYSLEGPNDVLVLKREEQLNEPLQNFNWKLLKTWPKDAI